MIELEKEIQPYFQSEKFKSFYFCRLFDETDMHGFSGVDLNRYMRRKLAEDFIDRGFSIEEFEIEGANVCRFLGNVGIHDDNDYCVGSKSNMAVVYPLSVSARISDPDGLNRQEIKFVHYSYVGELSGKIAIGSFFPKHRPFFFDPTKNHCVISEYDFTCLVVFLKVKDTFFERLKATKAPESLTAF